jgi:phospholipid/cholesterol/gamma-HCH transport system substrate-binding protein
MAERRQRLRLGVFVAAALVGLGGLVVLFGRAPDLFSNKSRFIVTFPEAPGVAVGTPIRKSGVRVGEVTTLDLDPETGQVKVGIAVDRKFVPRANEEANITRGLLSGDTAIDFLPKMSDDGLPLARGPEVPPGSTIAGAPPVTARSLLGPASGVLDSARQSLDRVARSFERLEKAAPKIERMSDEIADLARDARSMVPELKETNRRLQLLLGDDPKDKDPGPINFNLQPPAGGDPNNLRTLVKEIRDMIRQAQPAIPELQGAAKSARQAFDSMNDVLSPANRKQVTELIQNMNLLGISLVRFATSLNTLTEGAAGTLKTLDTQLNSVGGVIADLRAITRPLAANSDVLVKDVTESAAQLNKTIGEVRELLRWFARENGTIQKLVSDPSLYQSLDTAAVALARTLVRAERIAKDLEVFADKVARRPELIGVGGALRGSSGLKDSPFGPGLPSYRPDWPPAIPARHGANWQSPRTEPETTPVRPLP